MLSPSSRPLRTLIVAAAFAAASATAAAPASAATTTSHGTKTAKAKKAKAKTKAKKVKARVTGKADLVARGLEVDFLSEGFSIEAKVANLGTKRSRKSDVNILLSGDTTLDADDEFLDDVSVPRLQPGAERSIETEVEIPDELPSGDLYLLVCADGNANVNETDEANNCTSQLVASDATDDDSSADDDDDQSADQSSVNEEDDGTVV